MASREELLQSIQPDMKLTKNFFKRIYGYELTWPGFAETALHQLETAAGCGLARQHYERITAELDREYNDSMKEAAAWYVGEIKKKRGEKQRAEKLDKLSTEKLLKRKRELLLKLLLSQNSLM